LEELFRAHVVGTVPYVGPNPEWIWTKDFAEGLHGRGFSYDLDQTKIGYYLGEKGYGIETYDRKRNGHNWKAYVWDQDTKQTFEDYIPEERREQISDEVKGSG
jgi:hypothetical protein